MKRELPKFVYPKGKRGYLYFCRGKTTQRIQADFGTPEFWAEYAIALKGRAPIRPGKTFTALIESYKRSNRFSRLAPRTKADYDKVLTFIVDRIGGLDPAKMQRRSVIAYRDENAGAVRFANYLVQILRILFEHAHDIGWRNDNPAKGVSLLKSTAAPREPWPADLVEAFRAKATGPALLIFELCLGTGQRISDVLRMRWNDIEAGGVNVTQGKTGARLWVPLTPQLRAVLAVTAKDGLTIVTTRGGRMMSYKTAQGHVMRVRLQIGGEGHDIHGLRHTAASELARLGCSDELIQSVTGHSSARMVAHYAGAARQKARAKEAQKKRE